MKKVFEINYPDNLGREWLNIDNFRSCILGDTHIEGVPLKIYEVKRCAQCARLENEIVLAYTLMEAVRRVILGERVSEFELSFPYVRDILDLRIKSLGDQLH